MGLGQSRKRKIKAWGADIEGLEPRLVLTPAVTIPIVSGEVASFVDSDGSVVKVKLIGPGSGELILTNGEATGGSMDELVLTDTASQSRLRITSRGGTVSGTTINSLRITGSLEQDSLLKLLRAKNLDLSANGELSSDGNLGHVKLRDTGTDSQINVDGSVDKLEIRDVLASQINVAGTITDLEARTVGTAAQVSANTFISATIDSLLDGATLNAGSGGLATAKFGTIQNASVLSTSTIGDLFIKNDLLGSSITANMRFGGDANFGTLDDYVLDQEVEGTIGTIKVSGTTVSSNGAVNAIVASGAIGQVLVNGQDPGLSDPSLIVWEKNADVFTLKYIPLDVSQVTPGATGFNDDQVWIAVFGQEIVTPGTGVVPPVGTTYYLVADQTVDGNPNPQSTASLQPGPLTSNQVILPSSNLSDWDGMLSLPVPAPNHQYTGRIIISVGAPIQSQVNSSNGTVTAPSASNATDPSNGTFYDFLEFTVTNFSGVPNLDIDVSQVDSFGLPTQLQFFTDTAGTVPFNYEFTGTTTVGSLTITGITDTSNLGNGEAVTGPGIAPGTTIQSLVPATPTVPGQVTLNKPVTIASTNATFTAAAAGPVGVQATRDSIISGSGTNSFLQFLLGKITPSNTAAQPFLESYASQPTTPAAISSGVIDNVTNDTPMKITSINHGLTTGDVVTITGVQGAIAANGTFQVTVLDVNTFSLDGSDGAVNPTTGNAAYTGGGSWTQGTITGVSNAGPIVISTTSTTGLSDGDLVKIEGVLGNTAANGLFSVTAVTSNSFTLVDSQGNGTYTMGGVWSVYTTPPIRLVSPKDVVEALLSPQDADPLNNYYNNVIDQLFLKYFTGNINGSVGGGETFSLVSGASGSSVTYSGQTQQVNGSSGPYVLRLTATSGTSAEMAVEYDIYYPFFDTNLPDPDIYQPIFYTPGTTAPSWIISQGQQYESPSQMVFGCDAVFADNVSRGLTGTTSSILADLENSISSALNRGIALNDPSTWGNQQTWFQTDNNNLGAYNYWVEYWHQTGLTYGDLAYAYPYDDKFGASTNLNQNNVGVVKITLGAWGDTETASTTTLLNMPVVANQGGVVTLTAMVSGQTAPTGTVTFFIDGVPINSLNASAAPPLQPITLDGNGVATITANLPALAEGSISHTYTVTAVYSGDDSNLPSIAYQSLPLIGVNGDFLVSLSPGNGPAGTAVVASATLPGTDPTGTVDFYFALADGSSPQLLQSVPVSTPPVGNLVTANLTIPTTVLTFAGTTTNNSTNVSNVTNVLDLAVGQQLTNANITAGTTITGFAPPQLVLSAAATETTVVQLKANGIVFQGNITQGSTTVTGVMNLAGLTAGATIEGQGIPTGTTISQLNAGSVTLSQVAIADGSTTITSDGVGGVFLIQAVYTPTTGDTLTGISQFSVTA